MKKHEYTTIYIIIAVFVLFSLLHLTKQKSYDVLQVNTPFEIIVDKNRNGIADDNETITISKDFQYIKKERTKLDDALNIDNYSHYALYYLTEKYTTEVLLDKKIVLKRNNIYVDGENYLNILTKSGYIFKNNTPVNSEAFKKRWNQIKKVNYVLYNAKSNKYHQLECEYGHLAHNYTLVARSQLPKGALGCKYCITKKHKHKSNKQSKSSKTSISIAGIKLILADYTTNLKPNRHGNTKICKEIIHQINNAQSSIDIAIYGYDRVPKIERAIKRAIERGVKVRLVHDIDSSNKNIYSNTDYFAKLVKNSSCDTAPSYIKDKRKYTNSIMHNKFYIFDNQIVITGSANLSHTDMSDYNTNCIAVIYSDKLASIYKKEFEQMYNGKFHNIKEKINNKENIKVGDSTISAYFSPKDNTVNSAIIPKINSAKKYIYIPTFLITDKNVTNALINARKRGVDIKIIVDATNAKNTASKHNVLRRSGIKVKTENYAGKLHSKTILIDDKYCIIGSMNLSKSGNYKNDENILIINNSVLTKFYKNFFIYLWNKIPDYWLSHDVSAESWYSIGSCSDGIDNDYDGKTDAEDEGCKAKLKHNISK